MAKILLVEDDKSLREIYGVRLMAEGYEIVSAGDGEEALAMAIKERPDLIVSDVMMPKISGFDMLDILRSTTETKDVKVIMMTALSSEDQRARGEALGADRYLVKSQVGIEDVVRTVHEVIGDSVAPAATPQFGVGVPAPAASATEMPSPVEPVQAPVQESIPAPTAAVEQPVAVAPEQPIAMPPLPPIEEAPVPAAPVAPIAEPLSQPIAPVEPIAPIAPQPVVQPIAPASVVEQPLPAPAPVAPVEQVAPAPQPIAPIVEPAPIAVAPVEPPTPAPQPVQPIAPVEPIAPIASQPAVQPQPVATAPITPPVAPTPQPAPESNLPQPTAPFSSPAPASLGERVIEPLVNPTASNETVDIAAQMAQALGGTTPPQGQ